MDERTGHLHEAVEEGDTAAAFAEILFEVRGILGTGFHHGFEEVLCFHEIELGRLPLVVEAELLFREISFPFVFARKGGVALVSSFCCTALFSEETFGLRRIAKLLAELS